MCKSGRVELEAYPAPFFLELALAFAGDGDGLLLQMELSTDWVAVNPSLILLVLRSLLLLYLVKLRHLSLSFFLSSLSH